MFESLKVVLINMVAILMISAKGHNIITFVYDVTNKILSNDSNDTVDTVMWPKLGNQSISMREAIITLILWRFGQKNNIFEGCSNVFYYSETFFCFFCFIVVLNMFQVLVKTYFGGIFICPSHSILLKSRFLYVLSTFLTPMLLRPPCLLMFRLYVGHF